MDYLLKPFDQGRLDLALERARSRCAASTGVSAATLAATAQPNRPYLERILAREGPRVHVIPVAELDYVAARDDYVAFFSKGLEVRKQQTLAEVGAKLDPGRFVRTHRSFIVNVSRVVRVEEYARDSRLVVLASGAKLPLSRAGHARLQKLL